jgi:hypothetical protein
MKPLTEQQRRHWELKRRKGPWRYTLMHGVLLWGVPVGIVWSIVMAAMQGWNKFPLLLGLALVGFPLGGIVYGRLMWRIFEARYAATPQPRSRKR